MTETHAIIVGTSLQLLGAGFLLYQSWKTSNSLSKFPSEVTYDSLGSTISALALELKSQFSQQAIGFMFMLVGSGFQLYAA